MSAAVPTGITRARIEATLADLPQRHLLCVGDVMLDVEVPCGNGRLSPEAPVLVFDEQDHRCRAGGAANVAANIAALGAVVHLAGVIGNDPEGVQLQSLLDATGIDSRLAVVPGALHPTTRKTRFVAGGRQLLRIDRERRADMDDGIVERLVASVTDRLTRVDAIVVSDYRKGLITPFAMARLRAIGQQHRAPIVVDPKGRDWRMYGAVELIKPNADELALFTGRPCGSDAEVSVALAEALARCEAGAILVTRAARGAAFLSRGGAGVVHVPAHAVDVADVCGAGDTNIATLAACLAGGCDIVEAIAAAQLASSVAVRRRGNAVVGADDLLRACDGLADRSEEAPLSFQQAALLAQRWRAAGLRVGFTNGCFDLLHAGHIHALRGARGACDRLVVGLNGDASVRRLKGPTRPVNGEADRAAVLAAMSVVDAVVIFDDDRPEALIEAVRPDVLIKGGDYDPATMAGAAFVRSYGGTVIVSDLLPGRSTSRIVAHIAGHSPTGDVDHIRSIGSVAGSSGTGHRHVRPPWADAECSYPAGE